MGLILSGELAVLQAPVFDGLPFDPFALFDDGFGPAEVGIGGRHATAPASPTLGSEAYRRYFRFISVTFFSYGIEILETHPGQSALPQRGAKRRNRARP